MKERPQVFSASFMRIQIFWDMTLDMLTS